MHIFLELVDTTYVMWFCVYCIRKKKFSTAECGVACIVPMRKVQLFISRICSDWDQLPEKMRKPMTYRDGCTLHLMCGMFLHFLDVLEARAPSAEFPEFAKKLTETFMCGVMDPELAYVADTCVPPGDVMSIGPFRLGVPTNDLSGLVICSHEDFVSTFPAVYFDHAGTRSPLTKHDLRGNKKITNASLQRR